MKSFNIRGKYYPATAILCLSPPFGGVQWTIYLVDGSTVILYADRHNDLETFNEMCEYFGIRHNG